MKSLLLASAATLGLAASAVQADPVTYMLDASHSQIVFSYDHLGYSTTTGMFSGFEGRIDFDADDPGRLLGRGQLSGRKPDHRLARARGAFPVGRFLRRRRQPGGELRVDRDRGDRRHDRADPPAI